MSYLFSVNQRFGSRPLVELVESQPSNSTASINEEMECI